MGVNGANTAVNFGGGGSGGGGSGGGDGGGSNSPPGGNGWNDAPANLKAEIMASSFNTMAAPGGELAWNNQTSQIPSNNEILQVFKSSSGEEQSQRWIEYGDKLDKPYIDYNGQTITHSNGAIHLYQRHQQDFLNREIAPTEILRTIKSISETGTLIKSGVGYEVREWEGKQWRIVAENDGSIVTAFPSRTSK